MTAAASSNPAGTSAKTKKHKNKNKKQLKAEQIIEAVPPQEETTTPAEAETPAAVAKDEEHSDAKEQKDSTSSTESPASAPTEESKNKSVLFVRNLPFEATNEDLETYFSDIGPIRSCFVVMETHAAENEGEDEKEGGKQQKNKGYGFVHFAVPDDAEAAREHVKKVKFMGKRTLKTDFAIPKSYSKAQAKSYQPKSIKKPVAVDQLLNRKPRLIVRNLAFRCNEAHLRKAFKSFGTIVECSVPHLPDGKARGFGFVQFETMEEAQKAMEAVNGTEILGRAVAVDLTLPKQNYDQLVSSDSSQKDQSGAANEDDDEEEEDDDEEEEDAESEEEDEDEESADEDEMELDEDAEADSEDDTEVVMDMDEDDEAEMEEEEGAIPPKRNTAGVKKYNDDDGCTLFIRNLSFESTADDLTEMFSAYGPVRYSLVTMDRTTGQSRGTGFVRYEQKQSADDCLEAYERASNSASMLELNSQVDTPGSNQDARRAKKLNLGTQSNGDRKSILVPEPSLSASSTPFILNGRFLIVSLAVSKSEATKLTESRHMDRRAKDKRNLYLMREGVIFPNSNEARDSGLTPAEISKRITSYAERKRLLATNPNLLMSRTRLSLRSLGTKLDEVALRTAAVKAVKKFWEEVEKGERATLEKDVMEEAEKLVGGASKKGKKGAADSTETKDDTSTKSASLIQRLKGRKIAIKQVKILRSKDRIDASTGKPRSKGYGFIEFAQHVDALACLRWMNNNPAAFPLPTTAPAPAEEATSSQKGGKGKPEKQPVVPVNRRPIVEFAVENRQILKLREDRQKRSKQPAKVGPNKDDGGVEEGKKGTTGGKPDNNKKRKRADGADADEAGDKSQPQPKKDKRNNKKNEQKRKRDDRDGDGDGDGPRGPRGGKQNKKHKKDDATAPQTKQQPQQQQQKQQPAAPAKNAPIASSSSADSTDAKQSKKKQKKKPLTKAQARETREDNAFHNLVAKYKTDFFGKKGKGTETSGKQASSSGSTGGSKGGDAASFKRWFS
ncbi:RNA recognition motif-containing protein [Quaeritorhiza haematococci]|nr:RNA recognition motif-containing protein [Quaeritorhiza haematococci]